jgi:hypothetical protein
MNATHGFIRTWSGRKIDPTFPRPDDIDLYDMAHGLAYQPRWGGQGDFGKRWYSIAEHSVLVAREVLLRTKSRAIAFEGLLHDAPEAYILDVPRPIKRRLGAPYAEMEHNFGLAIGNRFKCQVHLMHPAVKVVDDQILHNEANAFMGPAQAADPDWELGRSPIQGLELEFLSPENAMLFFLDAFSRLKPLE